MSEPLPQDELQDDDAPAIGEARADDESDTVVVDSDDEEWSD